MFLIPYIRTSRAVSSCLLFPNHPIEAIATSEIISYIGPFLKKNYNYSDIVLFMFYYFYYNEDAKNLINTIKNKNLQYYQAEACLLSIFLCYSLINIVYL